jgi:hypothetical protein
VRSSSAAGGAFLLAFALFACGVDERPAGEDPGGGGRAPVEIAHYPLNGDAVPAGADAVFDRDVSQDGGGSLRVETGEEGGRLRLYRIDDLGPVEGALLFTGFLKSQDLRGTGFFELWCHPVEGNPAFVRGLPRRVAGTSDWKPQELSFSQPARCSNPTAVELNVVIQGAGTVWIDNLRLWDVPLE